MLNYIRLLVPVCCRHSEKQPELSWWTSNTGDPLRKHVHLTGNLFECHHFRSAAANNEDGQNWPDPVPHSENQSRNESTTRYIYVYTLHYVKLSLHQLRSTMFGNNQLYSRGKLFHKWPNSPLTKFRSTDVIRFYFLVQIDSVQKHAFTSVNMPPS